MPGLTAEHFILATGDSNIGLLFRTGPTQESISIARINQQLAFYKASAVAEEQFYRTGRFVGVFDNLVLVSVAPSVHVLEDGIRPVTYTANQAPVGPFTLKNETDKICTENDFPHAGLYHLLLTAALNARGHCRLPAVRKQASPDGIFIDYARAA